MATTGTLGRVDEFDDTKDDWPQYVERLEHFFLANGIDSEEKKRAVFLSVVGAAITNKTLRNIVSPAKPGEKSYDELVKALSKHFKPTPSEIVERFIPVCGKRANRSPPLSLNYVHFQNTVTLVGRWTI